jgi:glycosyltransferase involved in cell wall biosynthesis
MKPTLSVVMITYNEAENLNRSLSAITWADEIIVVDRHSEDSTVAIAQSFGAKVFSHEWLGFGAQKNLAISHATSDWVLSLDADEVISPQSALVIQQVLTQAKYDAFYLPRRSFFLGKWIMHGDWYPDWQLRLFKRGVTQFKDSEIHERVEETKSTSYLKQAVIDHYSYKDLTDYVTRLNKYTDLEAKTRVTSQLFNTLMLLFKPLYRFLKQYIWQGGFLDGSAGLWLALLSSWYVFIVHLKINELRRK